MDQPTAVGTRDVAKNHGCFTFGLERVPVSRIRSGPDSRCLLYVQGWILDVSFTLADGLSVDRVSNTFRILVGETGDADRFVRGATPGASTGTRTEISSPRSSRTQSFVAGSDRGSPPRGGNDRDVPDAARLGGRFEFLDAGEESLAALAEGVE